MTTIVVGFGVHPQSTRALEWAAAIARRSAARLLVLNVFHPSYVETTPNRHTALLIERRELVERVLERAGHENFEIVVREGEPVEQLLKTGIEHGADLLVVGHHGSNAPGGYGEGGAAELLLRKSTIAFAVVDDDAVIPDRQSPLTMVVGVDGSEANADSVDSIAALARAMDARTIPVLAVNTGASTARDHYGAGLVHQDEADAIVARLPGGETLRTINESPVQGLIDAADQNDATLIAIGTRGHLSLTDLVAGQVARHLIAHSKRPVLIAPHH